jgi:hypothetical protein
MAAKNEDVRVLEELVCQAIPDPSLKLSASPDSLPADGGGDPAQPLPNSGTSPATAPARSEPPHTRGGR